MASKAKTLVLVVDDEPDFRAIVSHILERAGYRVVAAADGTEALARFEESGPELVLLDGNLPDMDGFEVCRRIRARADGKTAPILMCTVRSAIGTVSEGFAAGATDYVLKPFDGEQLLERVASALAVARAKK